MKVTPVKKKFGKYAPGDEFELPDKAAKVFIKLGKLQAVTASMGYKTRMLTAEMPVPAATQYVPGPTMKLTEEQALADAPYGHKADGTPRKRPGRRASSE